MSELSKVSKVSRGKKQKTDDRRWEGVKEGSWEALKLGKDLKKIVVIL